ncbi:Fic family protein [Flavobacterium sp. RHBU_24]|uniref:Fic family protein n=1 Tax=Flavobacterium sp. RHBU_24 TaxID=3391185 RepID=UPI0039850C6D
MEQNLQILPGSLLQLYKEQFDAATEGHFKNLQESELSTGTFSFYTSVSAVFSSKIEGEEMDLDSFIKHKRLGVHYKPDYTQKIDDLYSAYEFAAENPLTADNVLLAHALLTRNILHPTKQGRFRNGPMFVITDDGKIEYVAAEPAMVPGEMEKFYQDLEILMNENLSFAEVFYYAAMLHLVFVKIHPFEDGNGRTGRLLEKWFLAEKLGSRAWFIQSEKNYYNNHKLYYHNLRALGLEYTELDYGKALPFLQMLLTT